MNRIAATTAIGIPKIQPPNNETTIAPTINTRISPITVSLFPGEAPRN